MFQFLINKIEGYLVFFFIGMLLLLAVSFIIENQQVKAIPEPIIPFQDNSVSSTQSLEIEAVIPTLTPNGKSINISNFPVKEGFLSSPFGMRKDPFHGRHRMHSGVDIAALKGTKIYPMGEGKVIFAGHKAGFGKTIEVLHGNTVVSRYSHLKSLKVTVGKQVLITDVIGLVGNTGRSTGSHLHLEVSLGGEKVDPQIFLAGQIASKAKPSSETLDQTSFATVAYQDYLQNFDGLFGLKAPE